MVAYKRVALILGVILLTRLSVANEVRFVRTDRGLFFGIEETSYGTVTFQIDFDPDDGHLYHGGTEKSCRSFAGNSINFSNWEFRQLENGSSSEPLINPNLPSSDALLFRVCSFDVPMGASDIFNILLKGDQHLDHLTMNYMDCEFKTGTLIQNRYGLQVAKDHGIQSLEIPLNANQKKNGLSILSTIEKEAGLANRCDFIQHLRVN